MIQQLFLNPFKQFLSTMHQYKQRWVLQAANNTLEMSAKREYNTTELKLKQFLNSTSM